MALQKVVIRLDLSVWKDFQSLCRQNHTTANAELREFVDSKMARQRQNKTERIAS